MRPALTPWGWLAHYWWTGKKMSTFSTRGQSTKWPLSGGSQPPNGLIKEVVQGKGESWPCHLPRLSLLFLPRLRDTDMESPRGLCWSQCSYLNIGFGLVIKVGYMSQYKVWGEEKVNASHYCVGCTLPCTPPPPHDVKDLFDEWRDCVYSSRFSDDRVSVTCNSDLCVDNIFWRWRIQPVFERKSWDNGHARFVLFLKHIYSDVGNSCRVITHIRWTVFLLCFITDLLKRKLFRHTITLIGCLF